MDEDKALNRIKGNYQDLRVTLYLLLSPYISLSPSLSVSLSPSLSLSLSLPLSQSKYEELNEARLSVSKLEKDCLSSVSKLSTEGREHLRSDKTLYDVLLYCVDVYM